ncbi:MAG: DUF3786 domain-containing protein [Candidatus Latescibacteria bacterium]|jgi:hypothetical protein|nr:DUF3786 domain-containing protein [Candidatus Latescibacterota bacterium]
MNVDKREKNARKHLHLSKNLAFEKLKAMDFADVAGKAGGTLHEENEGIWVNYLGKPVRVAAQAMMITCEPDDWAEFGGAIQLKEEIFILHYLLQASGRIPTGNLIPFRSMDGGMAYESVFRARSVGRLLGAFRSREERLTDIGGIFGGIPGDLGNVSVRLRVLPQIEIELVIWRGDDEIPSSGNIFFDESITEYLPTEDCVVITESVVERFIHVLNQDTHGKNVC